MADLSNHCPACGRSTPVPPSPAKQLRSGRTLRDAVDRATGPRNHQDGILKAQDGRLLAAIYGVARYHNKAA